MKPALRPLAAFLIAPLVVPVALAVYYSGPSATWIAASLFIVTLVGYLGTFMTIPVYLFLVRRRCTSFWLAPVVGFLAGGVTHAGFYALLALMLGYSASGIGQLFDQEFRGMLQETAWPYGPLGALVGCVLWLIARPDRANPDQPHEVQPER